MRMSTDPVTTEAPAGAQPWQAEPAATVLERLGSRASGLTEAEAAERLRRHGPNVTGAGRGDSLWAVLGRQLASPLIAVLLVSGAVALALGDAADAAVVFGVVAANTALGFVQEWRAGKAIQALASMVPEHATVWRAGERVAVPAVDVVPGDVIDLEAGERVPADARLLRLDELEVDESALTGESLPVAKAAAPLEAGTPVADRRSMVHGGTLVTRGTATSVVVATAAATEIGRIAGLLESAEGVETPLTRRLSVVARWLTAGICAVAVVLVPVALARGFSAVEATLAAVALAVAAIPEGLPAIVTIALAVGVQRMAGRRAVVRRLPAVETLGGTTVICTDKTGTLTPNEMRVARTWTAPGGDEQALLRAIVLCNDAPGSAHPDPTETALLDAAAHAGLDPAAVRAAVPRVGELPFDSVRKLMATVHAVQGGGDPIVCVKGAPEAVLPRCAAFGSEVDRELERLTGEGMRVLAVAQRRSAVPVAAAVEHGLRLLGFVAMVDPPRPEAIAAVEACREAGIEVKMITGDHAVTASAIGERFGLVGEAVGGSELDAMGDAEFADQARARAVFARVAPEHKLRLVRALQSDGQVVAMTGDGVNDAPALKQADIGVAMGKGGTATAREAADLVLTDDDFASIAAAVEEGRRVYDNVQKAIAFALPTRPTPT
jgi:calcium-translocating P-type ATPase